jgi:peptidoglycan/LPS O-acetylase OafA/YrhL
MIEISKSVEKQNNAERIYFPELDGLRFFAFLLVFLHHQSLLAHIPFLFILNANGWIGVDLFFALSAFLFTKLLIAEFNKTKTISFKKFYKRRIYRIWPVYFLVIAISIAFFVFQNGGNIDSFIGLRIFGLLTFSDNILTAVYGYNPLPYIAHLWTITYEEQFYIFIPFIILFLVRSSSKTKLIFLISMLLLFNIIRIMLIANHFNHTVIWVLPITHFESIFLGIIIGFGGFDFLLKWFKPAVLGIIGLVLFLLIYYLPDLNNISYVSILNYTCIGLSTSLVLFSVSKTDILKKFFAKKIFVFLGKRSYGLYTYHLLGNAFAAFLISKFAFFAANTILTFIYSLSFTIIASIVSYEVIEKPFLKLKKKFEVITSRPI